LALAGLVDLTGVAGVGLSDTVAVFSTGFVKMIFGKPADARVLVTSVSTALETSAGTAM